MTDKTTLLRAFNTHFFDLIADLMNVLPDNNEISYANTSFETIKKANPTIIIKTWYKFVFLPYKDLFDTGNLNFFIDKDYGSELNGIVKSEEILKMIDNIRNPIRDMDEINKQKSLKYIQNLCKLSELYNDQL